MGSGRSLDDSFTRSASFRRSKQVKAISNLIHGSSSGVKAMFRTTWTGSADELGRNRMSRSRSPSATPPTSGHSSPSPQRRETFASRSVDRELMPPPSGPARKRREAQSTNEGNPTPEEIPRTISEPSLIKERGSKTFIWLSITSELGITLFNHWSLSWGHHQLTDVIKSVIEGAILRGHKEKNVHLLAIKISIVISYLQNNWHLRLAFLLKSTWYY